MRPLADDVIGNVGDTLWILLAAVGVVLLIACGNVANLFLIRAEARQQELAMRAALGASRGRLARALLSESVVLALAGGVARPRCSRRPRSACCGGWRRPSCPRLDEIGIDPTVLLFTLSISVLSGVVLRRRRAAEVRQAQHRGAQGRRPIGERRAQRAIARATRWSSAKSRWR